MLCFIFFYNLQYFRLYVWKQYSGGPRSIGVVDERLAAGESGRRGLGGAGGGGCRGRGRRAQVPAHDERGDDQDQPTGDQPPAGRPRPRRRVRGRPLLPLLRSPLDSRAAARRLQTRLLVLLAERDSQVPLQHSLDLVQALRDAGRTAYGAA